MRINQGLLLPPLPVLPLLLLLLLLPPPPPPLLMLLLCSTRHGYNSSLSADVVFTIESTLGNVTNILEQLAMDMFSVSGVYSAGDNSRGVAFLLGCVVQYCWCCATAVC